ncbi:hypothetical protein KFE25_009559 [Diacronema lutheri]|uniref:Uncharacterized protein n=2 Tax=Diacronema lutheri TaxID=2081491 RepID=A0A8J5XMS6_DIALT|nr:hypothetical protein KFE25_009559 [Diacronema lutheri]
MLLVRARRAPRAPAGARSFFDEITADIAARARAMRRARTANVLRQLEPAQLLPSGTRACDEPNLARALNIVQAHAPAGGAWTAPALRAAAAHAARALDDAHAAAQPAPGATALSKMPVPPPEPDALPDLTPAPADLAPASLTFEAAADALAPLARIVAVQGALRQLDALLGGAAAGGGDAAAPTAPPAELRALGATPEALAGLLADAAFGAHGERVGAWVRIWRLGTRARAPGAEGVAEGNPMDMALTVDEAMVLTRRLEQSAAPGAAALLLALEDAMGTFSKRGHARELGGALSAGGGDERTDATVAASRKEDEGSSDVLQDDESGYVAPWLERAVADLADAPAARRPWHQRLPSLPRRAPRAERALRAHYKALALEPDAAGAIRADALARRPPAQLASSAALLEAAAASFHSFADEQRARAEARRDNRFYAAAFAAAVALDVTLSYI